MPGEGRKVDLLRIRCLKPMLNLEHSSVAMRQPRREGAVVALLPAGRIDQEHSRRLDHDRRSEEAINQLQGKVGPSHHAASRDDVAVVDDQAVRIHSRVREARLELLFIAPVCRHRPAGEKSRLPEQERALADRAKRGACPMAVAQPRGEEGSLLRRNGIAQAGRKHQDDRETFGFGGSVEHAAWGLPTLLPLPVAHPQQGSLRVLPLFPRQPISNGEEIRHPEHGCHLDAGVHHQANLGRALPAHVDITPKYVGSATPIAREGAVSKGLLITMEKDQAP